MPKIELQKGAKNLVRFLTAGVAESDPIPVPGEPPVESPDDEYDCRMHRDYTVLWPISVFWLAPLIAFILVIYRVVKGYEKPNASKDRIIFGSIIGAFLVFPTVAEVIFEHASWVWEEYMTRMNAITCSIINSSIPDSVTILSRVVNVSLAAMMIFVYIKWFKTIMDMDPLMFMGALALLYGLGPLGIVILAFISFSSAKGKGKKSVKNKSKSKSK